MRPYFYSPWVTELMGFRCMLVSVSLEKVWIQKKLNEILTFRLTLLNAQTIEVPDDTEKQQDVTTTRLSSVPPCTPTPVAVITEGTDLDNEPESGVDQGEVEEEDSQSLLMGVVSQISSEPAADYMKDIWQLQLRDLRKACLEYIRWPGTKQAPCVESQTSTGSIWRFLFYYQPVPANWFLN